MALARSLTRLLPGTQSCFFSSKSVYCWGENSRGCLGVGDKSDHPNPRPLMLQKGISIQAVAAGMEHAAFLSEEGDVYTSGCGKNYKLGHGDEAGLLVCE